MTLFYGTYDNCRCISHPVDMSKAYEDIHKFLRERGQSSYRLKTWVSPEKITTVEFGNPRYEFYAIDENAEVEEQWRLTNNSDKLSMRKWEKE
jgi:hypothetical protein